MNANSEVAKSQVCWFVGASYNSSDDQTPRFLRDGIWENGYEDRYLDLVKSMKPGDRIAIKAAYTRRHGLPFDNRGQTVSVMALKAVGTVIENPGDGRTVRVNWERLDPVREWYFFTNRLTIWRVTPDDWARIGLIDFAFSGIPQNIDQFRNAPFWRGRFGDQVNVDRRFGWTRFYEELANGLAKYKDDRSSLVSGIKKIASRVETLNYLFEKGIGLDDICPFTVMGMFNRGITNDRRRAIARELADFLEIKTDVPLSFDGIPVLYNQASWFYGPKKERKPDDIDALWDVFSAALQYADSENENSRATFSHAFDNSIGRPKVGWKLTFGLYWIRPWSFATLDKKSRAYIFEKLRLTIGQTGPKERCRASEYLTLSDSLEQLFTDEAYPVHSFPELSLAAWEYRSSGSDETNDDDEIETEDPADVTTFAKPYAIRDILADGCFLEQSELEVMLRRFSEKKNVILQGPPGTGKTWLARRLAYALIGTRDDSRVRALQFHPNYSYEDFIRGWRPSGDGKLELVDGPFLQTVKMAITNPTARFVVVIEEVNRGNPAQIFGEMLTLLDPDKRTPTESLELCYRFGKDDRVFIPPNVFVIGTMNIADRSIALVDLALRRRFAFVDLEPRLGTPWREWVSSRFAIPSDFLTVIEARLTSLNDTIANDPTLGKPYRIGHSFVTPPLSQRVDNYKKWYREIVLTEIGPQLDEYWFDRREKVEAAITDLLKGI